MFTNNTKTVVKVNGTHLYILLTMRRIFIALLSMLLCLCINAANVNINDIIGDWKHIPGKGVVMAGDIIMNISASSISQSLYSQKRNTKSDIFHSSYYLSEAPATSWNNDLVGKVQSGSYIVRNVNGRLVQSKVSFDSEGMLVLEPYNSERGITMRFRRMSDGENESVRNADMADELGLLMSLEKVERREKEDPLIEIMTPGSLLWQVKQFAKSSKAEAMTTVRIGGPMNAYDLAVILNLDEYFPRVNSLDLSLAWFVTDSLAYESLELTNVSHEHFSNIRGLHMKKNFSGSALSILHEDYENATYDACYDRYGWLVEEKKDKLYRHFSTTIDDCVSEIAFSGVSWLKGIILPMSTKEIHWQAFSFCPQLQEVIIPPDVKSIANQAFSGNKSLSVIRVADDSPLREMLEADLHSEKPKILGNCNPNLRIETYVNRMPDVTFTIRGTKKAGKYPIYVSDYTNHKKIRKLDATGKDFAFSVTVPQYSIIGFNNLDRVVIAEGGDVYIDLSNDSLSGTPLNDKLNRYNKTLNKIERGLRRAIPMLDRYANVDSVSAIKSRIDSLQGKLHSYITKYFLSNSNNCLSAYMVARYYDYMPERMVRTLFMSGVTDALRDPLLKNEWEWMREASRTVHIDCHGYSDTRFMTPLTNVKGGALKTLQIDEEWETSTRLKIDGPLNADDIRWLRDLCRNHNLQALDLSDAYIVDEKGQPSAYMPDSSFAFNHGLKYIALPKSIKVIGRMCFYDSNGLEYIKMYDNVGTIESEAFANAVSLLDFTLPANLERMGDRAFWQCSNIRQMLLPEKVKEIGINAFGFCRNLHGLHIPASTEKIGKGVIKDSRNVTVTIDKENKNYKVISNVIIGLTKEACKASWQVYSSSE